MPRPSARPGRRISPARLGLLGLLAAAVAVAMTAAPATAGGPILVPAPPPTKPTLQPAPTFPVTMPPTTTTPPITLPPVPTSPPKDIIVWGGGDSFTGGEGASRDHKYVPLYPGATEEDFRHLSGLAPLHTAFAYLEAGRRGGTYTLKTDEMLSHWDNDRFYFSASSGAATRHIKNVQYEDDDHPSLATVRNPAQISGLPDNADIAYFGFGGNDVGFGPVMRAATSYYYYHMFRTINWREQERAVAMELYRQYKQMPQATANIERGLATVHAKAQQAEIVVALYPIGVKQHGNADTPQIAGITLDLMYDYAVALNKAITDAVTNFRAKNPGVNVHVFDPNKAGPNGTSVVAGHEIGQPDSYFNGVIIRKDLIGKADTFKIFQESFHPNEVGALAIGKALATFMANELPSLYPNGPDFSKVGNNAQAAVAPDPDADLAFAQWVQANPEKMCDGLPTDSICHFTGGDDGVLVPSDVLTNPIPLLPIDGADVVSGGGSATTTTYNWIPATYSYPPAGYTGGDGTGGSTGGDGTGGSTGGDGTGGDGGTGGGSGGGGFENQPTGSKCGVYEAVDPGGGYQMQASTSTVSGGSLRAPLSLVWVGFESLPSQPSDPCEELKIKDVIEQVGGEEEWA